MSGSFRPRHLHDVAVVPHDPRDVVEAFLAALAAPDLATAGPLLDEHVRYVNVGLPAIRGRRATMKALGMLEGKVDFEVYLHAVAVEGGTVLTERTDVLAVGPVRLQFWVTGRFDVRDGRIVLWRDSFDYVDLLRALGRGLVGALVPPLRPAPPASADVPPGRH